MDLTLIGIIGICLLLALIAYGVPIGFSMAIIGLSGLYYLTDFSQTLSQLSLITWHKGTDYTLLCLPLFILMGQLVSHTGLGADLYDCVQKWFGRLRGGLAIATVIGCAIFGAMTGGSIPAIAVFGPMVLPEMKKYKYDRKLATGSLSAAGTLAVLIPPSFCMVFYGILTDTSIGSLFIAGIIPGIILTLAISCMIYLRCLIHPALGPMGPKFSWKERFASLTKLLPIATLFILVIGGIYGGFFSPTEASGIGAAGVFVIALLMKRLTLENLKRALHETGIISAMVFVIIVGGFLISRFLVLTEITSTLINAVSSLNMDRTLLLCLFVLIYLLLGAILDVYGMLILTIPFMFPIITSMGIDPVWFGIFITIMTEMALVTPPIGINIYVIHEIAPEVPLTDLFLGTVPFVIVAILMVFLLMAFPGIALWLPSI
jgi:tripartite ATP-independent transporter DctM subunit